MAGSMKKEITVVFWGIILLLLFSCGYETAGVADEYPDPVFRSIIPLKAHNLGSYKVTYYDDQGSSITYVDTIRNYISEAYAYYEDSLITYYDYYLNFYVANDTTKIIFPYGWMVSKSEFSPKEGYLVWHREATDSTASSLEIHGVFNQDSTVFWVDSTKTWLQYPAQTGSTWELLRPGNSTISQWEIVGTDMPKFLSSAIPMDCYVYKEMLGELTSYHYYHPQWGLVASLQFKEGKRVKALHILTSNSYIYTN